MGGVLIDRSSRCTRLGRMPLFDGAVRRAKAKEKPLPCRPSALLGELWLQRDHAKSGASALWCGSRRGRPSPRRRRRQTRWAPGRMPRSEDTRLTAGAPPSTKHGWLCTPSATGEGEAPYCVPHARRVNGVSVLALNSCWASHFLPRPDPRRYRAVNTVRAWLHPASAQPVVARIGQHVLICLYL